MDEEKCRTMSPTLYFMKYQCQVCGRKATTPKKSHPAGEGDIPRCLVCHKYLCLKCNKYGLCPEHYSSLPTQVQLHVEVLRRKVRNKTMYGVIVIIAGIVTIALLMVFGLYSQGGNAIAGWGVLIGGIILTLCLAGCGGANIDMYVASQVQQGSQVSSSQEDDFSSE